MFSFLVTLFTGTVKVKKETAQEAKDRKARALADLVNTDYLD